LSEWDGRDRYETDIAKTWCRCGRRGGSGSGGGVVVGGLRVRLLGELSIQQALGTKLGQKENILA
jgi:hypothetical protein